MLRFLSIALCLTFAFSEGARAQQVLQDSVVGNVTLTNDRTWLLRGFVYVVNGAVLTIEPGTVIFGEKSSKGTLIVERGGKLIAVGEPNRPIVFTSQVAPGQRAPGDWGGIAICGRAPMNLAAGEAQLEGGPRSRYGGNVEDDNSGILRYVRIEYPGIALAPNSEINGLTLASVGSATQIDHVQVSYSGDDAFEWFGGAVSAKYLIALASVDDDWDTDFGWHGSLQFGVSLRHPNYSDVSTSNGVESDNNNVPNFATPRTSPTFSNMTIVGPMRTSSDVVNPLFGQGAHLKKNTLQSIFNSVIIGWPKGGINLDQTGVANAAQSGELSVENTIIAGGNAPSVRTNVSGFDALAWFNTGAFQNGVIADPNQLELVDPFNLTAPKFYPAPGSALRSGAEFSHARLQNPFFVPVEHRGAFGSIDWTIGWSNFDPQNTSYVPVVDQRITSIVFSVTPVGAKRDTSVAIVRNSGHAPLAVTNLGLNDTSRFKLVGGSSSFSLLPGASHEVVVSFVPSDSSSAEAQLTFTANGQNYAITVSGKGQQVAPSVKIETGSTLDFALVRTGESVEDRIIITNSGNGTLELNGFSISGPDASSFSIVSGNGSTTIAPKAKHVVTVRFSPTDTRDFSASFTFNHNAASGTSTVVLRGKGIVVYGQDVLQGEITGNVTLTNDRIWLLRGFVYVVDGATLNIEPGSVIFGEKSTKGTLIIERGGTINAQGTPTHPIVFTSQMPVGQKASGDWGGVLILGRAPINLAAGEAQVEGGPRSMYGGSDPADNSGVFSYVRIEYPGIALSPNNETNGLTLGAVGSATKLDHVQVSFSGDDSYEWFGGTVSASHLVAHRAVDDDWDTDFGFQGNVQFGVSVRDPQLFDISGSNGFESDNNNVPNTAEPRTAPKFSNITVVGPLAPGVTSANPLFQNALHIRRNSMLSLHNSVVLGYTGGLYLDQTGVVEAAQNGGLRIQNNIFAGIPVGKEVKTNVSGFDAAAWFNLPANANSVLAATTGLGLDGAFDLESPDFTPSPGSPALSGASFESLPAMQQVNFRGAFGLVRWDSLWANYDPAKTDYAPNPQLSSTAVDFGSVAQSRTETRTVVLTNAGAAPLRITSISIQGSADFSLSSGAGFTVIQQDTHAVVISYTPSSVGVAEAKVILMRSDNSVEEIQLKGEGVVLSVERSDQDGFTLLQNTPNPAGTATAFEFVLEKQAEVRLSILDLTGKVVSTLVDAPMGVGHHRVTMDVSGMVPGVYFYQLMADGVQLVRRMTVVR